MATYSADISVKVVGLTSLTALETRLEKLQATFTKINAAASQITAPFQAHIQALQTMNTLLQQNGRLLNAQASAVAKATGRQSGGRGPAAPDARLEKERSDELQRQLGLLKDRARVLQGNTTIMAKLLRAEVEITAAAGGNVKLGKELMKNARALLAQEERLARIKASAADAAVADAEREGKARVKAVEDEWRAAETALKKTRNARAAAGTGTGALRTGLNIAGRAGGVVDRAFGGAFSGVGRAAEGAVIRGGAVAGGLAAMGGLDTLNTIADKVPGISAASGAVADLVSTLANLPGGIGAAAVAAAAFAPWLPAIAKGANEAGRALGQLDAAQPLKKFLTQGGASFFESPTNALSGMSMDLKSLTGGAAMDLSRKSGAFGAKLDMQLLPKIAQQLVQSALAEAAAADKIAAARGSWVTALTQGRNIQQDITRQVREEEQAASDAARSRLSAAVAARRNAVPEVVRRPIAGAAYPNGPAGPEPALNSTGRDLARRIQAEAQAAQQLTQIELTLEKQVADYELDMVQKQLVAEIDAIEAITDRQMKANKLLQKDWDQRFSDRQYVKGKQTEKSKAFGDKAESIALGVGFPLMFGAGAGSIAGSALGSFVGKGFGGQIFGGAIGAMLDTFTKSITDLGTSLKSPTDALTAMETAGLKVSDSLKYNVGLLMDSGRAYEAQGVVIKELNRRLGTEATQALFALSAEQKKLTEQWDGLVSALQSEIIPAITGATVLFQQLGGVLDGLTKSKLGEWLWKIYSTTNLGLKIFEAVRGVGVDASKNAKPPELTPDLKQSDADARLGDAQRAEALRRQGIQQENQAIDLRRNLEEQVYGFRQRAADMERANIDLRRSVEDEIFSKRQEIARQEIDNDRKRAQLAIERTDLGLAGMRGFSNEPGQEIANRLLDATREYIRARGEGEADLRAKERTFTVEVEDLKRASEKLRFEVGRKVADLQRQANDYTRDVEKARFSAERAIYDLQISAADYRVAKAKEAITLETEAASRLQMTQGLTANVSGGGNLGSGAYPLTSQRGPRWGRQHHGIDYAAPIGTPISTTLGGKVNSSGYEAGYGNWVEVQLENGVKAFWAHLSEVVLKQGQAFNAGQIIAKTGNTGRGTGPHLHSGDNSIGNAGDAYTRLGGKVVATAKSPVQASPLFQNPQLQFPTKGTAAATARAAAPANNIVPTAGVAAPRSVDTSSAMAGLNSLSAPGAVGVGDLLAQFAKFDAQLIRTKGQALELDKAFAQMTDVQRQQAFQQAIAQTVQELNAPIDALLSTQQDQLAYQREYGALVQEGMLPALAEQILKIREQVALELQKVDFAVLQYKTQIEYLKSKGLETTELEKQLKILEAQRDIIEGKGKQAEEGAKEAESPGQRLQGAYDKIKGELNALTDPVNQVIAGANAIGEAFGQAFAGLVSGSMTAKEALRSFFQSTAQHFIDMASQMIAKYLAMKLIGLALSAFGGGGGTGSNFGGGGPGAGLGDAAMFAEGGYVTSATPAVFGEAGPEYAIPASKMGAAMANYSAGKRGAAVLDDTGGGSAAGGGGGAGGGTFTLETVVINNIEYATVAQVREMGQVAAKQGADGGHSRVMGDFRNSRSTRSRLGVR